VSRFPLWWRIVVLTGFMLLAAAAALTVWGLGSSPAG